MRFRLIVVQKHSFPRKPILLYSTGLLNNSKKEPPPSTGVLGRPLKASWNPPGVNPIHQKTADIDPGSLKWLKNEMNRFV